MTHPDLQHETGRASAHLAGQMRIALETNRAAAVLVAVLDDDGPPRIVLTRRAAHLSTHAGQIALPGGRVDEDDGGPVAAALREAREEVGLNPDRVEVIGLLDDILRRTTAVTPVLGRVVGPVVLEPDPSEVDAVFEIPLAALRDPAKWSIPFSIDRLGQSWPVFCFEWQGQVVWGLTAYVVLLALDALGGAPMRLPAPYDRSAEFTVSRPEQPREAA